MGCSAAKNVTVEQIDLQESHSNGVGEESNQHTTIHTSNIPVIEAEDIPEDVLENSSVDNLQKGANGLSFEIKFDEKSENTEDSIIHKHPPKRILELQESQGSPPTLQKLKEKLEDAEIRRQQILQQRIQSASVKKPLKFQGSESVSFEYESIESPHHLKVPSEKESQPQNPYDIAYI